MISLSTLYYSCLPSWYDNFHTRRGVIFRQYLWLLLVLHTILRTFTFTNIYHVDFFENFSPLDCLEDLRDSFPKDLVINLDTKTRSLEFTTFEDDFDPRFFSERFEEPSVSQQKEYVIYQLPLCVRQLVGISTSFLSKSSLSVASSI